LLLRSHIGGGIIVILVILWVVIVGVGHVSLSILKMLNS
jgi:hypothetical protein